MANTINYFSSDHNMDFFLFIRNQFPNFTSSQQQIANYLIENKDKIANQTAYEISQCAHVSEASVVRFCKALGFKGFKELKIKMVSSLGSQSEKAVPSLIEQNDSPTEVVTKLMRLESEDIKFCLKMLDMAVIIEVINLINACDRIVFFGVGSSAIAADNAMDHFIHYGKNAQAESESYKQIALANSLGPRDLAFAISISGNSLVPIQAIEIAKKNGAATVCITQNSNSHLAKMCDKVIYSYRKSKDLDDLGTATRIVQISIIDAIAVAYATMNWDKTEQIAAENRSYFKTLRF